MSSWPGAVTIASATSGTVSETREIGAPIFSTVDRPTRRSTSVALGGRHLRSRGEAVRCDGAESRRLTLWCRLLRLRRRDQNHDDEGGKGRPERCCPHWDVPPKTVASYQLPPVDAPGVVRARSGSVTSCQSVSSRRVGARETDTLETGNSVTTESLPLRACRRESSPPSASALAPGRSASQAVPRAAATCLPTATRRRHAAHQARRS